MTANIFWITVWIYPKSFFFFQMETKTEICHVGWVLNAIIDYFTWEEVTETHKLSFPSSLALNTHIQTAKCQRGLLVNTIWHPCCQCLQRGCQTCRLANTRWGHVTRRLVADLSSQKRQGQRGMVLHCLHPASTCVSLYLPSTVKVVHFMSLHTNMSFLSRTKAVRLDWKHTSFTYYKPSYLLTFKSI